MSDFQPKPFGKYFLIEKLATGGMAEIYKAKTFGVDGFEKQLAIKRILPHCSNDKEFIHMLIDEAKLSVLLSHTNIAQVFDLGKVGDDYFISLEFVDGSNLREVMNRAQETGEALPAEIAVYIMSEICKGLDYAHSKKDSDGNPLNIVHRDVSPQNVLISYEGEVKIVDFGIAKAAMNMSHTMAGVLKGKITYMSPEQALGKPVDYKTDIFSAGLILYELLTGKKFFTGDTQFEVLKKIRSTRITESSFPDSIPAGLKVILAKALAYSQKDRFENAGDMQLELTKYLYSTYLDFSPRKLSNLMRRLFSDEIQRKKTPKKEEAALDSQTRSILLNAAEQENIVHRTDFDKTNIDSTLKRTQTQFPGGGTGDPTNAGLGTGNLGNTNSALYTIPGRNWWRIFSLLILLLVLGGGTFWAYREYLRPAPQGQRIGVLIVNSVPQGAKIYLNDKDTQLLTPATLSNIDLNISQKVALKKEKFSEWSRLVTLISPQPLSIEATLETVPSGSISVVTHPEGAKLFLDGKELKISSPGQIPDLELNKTYTLRLEKEDYRPVEERITIYSTEPVKYDKKLEEIKYSSAEIRTTPAGVKIYLNNQDTGLVSPNRIAKLEVGKTYTIRLSKDKYRDISRNIEITSEKPIVVTEKLLSEEEIKKKEEEEKKKKAEQEKKAQEEALKKGLPLPTPTPTPTPTPPPTPGPTEKPPVGETPKPEGTGPAYIALNSNPGGADVFINGEKKGSTPGKFQVSPGTVEVILSKTGAGKVTRSVSVKAGETKQLGTIDLGGEFGSIKIESSPSGASVSVDGAGTGKKTPIIIKGVRKGRQVSVTLQLEGYETWSRSVTMDEDSKSFSATLKKKE